MTIGEVNERYHIPMKILREYEGWGLCGTKEKVAGAWQYDDRDMERLGMIMTLHDIGFTCREVEIYMRLMLEGEHTKRQRMAMLGQRRGKMLEEIHRREKQIEHVDYLRYEMQKHDMKL